MDEKKISVKLIGPAKIDGIREPAGKTVSVTPKLALELAAAGVIPPLGETFDVETPLASDFDKAVASAVAEKEREIRAKAEAAVSLFVEEHNAALAGVNVRADAAEAKVAELNDTLASANQRADAAEAKVAELEAQIAAGLTNTAQAGSKPAAKKT